MKNNPDKQPFFGEFGDSIDFNTASDCRPDAPQIIWRPANIGFRQNNEEEERFFLNLYLKWVFKMDTTTFELPLAIKRAGKEREPDFFVNENGRHYGLEITRATTWRSERATDALSAAGPGHFMEIDSGQFGEECDYHPADDIKPQGARLDSEPLLGLDLEKEWGRCTAHRIVKKQNKLATNYSLFFAHCDLVLYSSFPVLELEDGVRFLQAHYMTALAEGNQGPRFQRITIVSENWAIFEPLGTTPRISIADDFPYYGSLAENKVVTVSADKIR